MIHQGPNEHEILLRGPGTLFAAAKAGARYRGVGLTEYTREAIALRTALEAWLAARTTPASPDHPDVEAAREAAERELAEIARDAFEEELPDEFFRTFLAVSELRRGEDSRVP